MARTLPWTIDHARPAKKQRTAPAQRPKVENKSSPAPREGTPDQRDTAPHGRHSILTPKKNSGSRSPSSSPSKAPPTTELMHEGYDSDDIYIMVEDEFQDIAKAYTAHLHLAEYKRLMKQAREAPPKALPAPTSPMSKEATRRLQSAALQKKQKDTLQRVMRRADSEEEEEQKVVDPWSGTSLAPLMASGNQQKTSLLGLEKMSSNTKAGMGFNNSPGGGKRERDYEEEAMPEAVTASSNSFVQRSKVSDGVRSETARSKASSVSLSRLNKPPRLPPGSSVSNRDEQSGGMVSSQSANDRDSPEIIDDDQPSTQKPRLVSRPNGDRFLKRRLEKEQQKRARLEEIPMFIT
ncbi:hypothetical protein PV11_02855 [Exophiala sideris]|uniref:Uncharacterized protein n=1 Tax=Exophiala sideris TaxID=1016849 RepID=A0A0D1WEP7_9EURO|nr:hypothetical protein PV11_02855 [Exophiala sideris]